jgi:iron-sulfur cluster assembly accessory protein
MDTQTQAAVTQAQASSTDSTQTAAPARLSLSERAVTQLREVIKAQGFEGYFFTVRVVPSGCSGFGYDVNLLKEAKPSDLTWEQDGIKVATDGLSMKYLAGTVVDYVVGDHSAGFKFENPQAKSSCGCGSSFST